MKDYPFFKKEELVCKCCGNGEMNDAFMSMVCDARARARIPFKVTSAYRCVKYDTEIGGGGNHTTGMAIDIKANDKRMLAEITFSLIRAGISRIGVDFNRLFVHADAVIWHPFPALWEYKV
jgi:uncharacterized protein YcbK (DUF882 family)